MFGRLSHVDRTGRSSKFALESILSRRLNFVVLLGVISLYYLFLLSNGTFQLFAPELLDKAFDNMLVHLLHGDFTVDRSAIGYEAFTRNGKTYAYFGVFSALLRLLVIPFTNIAQAHVARLSCLSALVIFVALQLRMLLIVHRSLPAPNQRPLFLWVMMVATVLSGPQLYILGSAMIYHEPVLWSAAMAAGFNLIIVHTTFGAKRLRGCDLALLAGLAGLAINTRQSIGGALYLSTTLLIVWTMWRRYGPNHNTQQLPGSRTPFSSILPAIAVLGLVLIAVGFINYERWGNAFTFVNYYDYDLRKTALPNLTEMLHKYGAFNIGRVWIGALYYAAGIPYILIRKTVPPFTGFLHAYLVYIEAPPIIPMLTNPLTVGLAGIGLYRICWKAELGRQDVTILRLVLVGHASAAILVLGYYAFTLRYRFDFAPLMTLAALIGYRSLSIKVSEAPESWQRRIDIAAIGLCILGILSSHYTLLIHKVWCSRMPIDLRDTLFHFAPFIRPETC
jgi:hypothetical protein